MYTPSTEHVFSSAYRRGVEAGSKDNGYAKNPYPEKTLEHDQWTLGWCFGFANQPLEVA